MVLIPNSDIHKVIPWIFTEVGTIQQWEWEGGRNTNDPSGYFYATITHEAGRWRWDVLADGGPHPIRLRAGVAANLEACEQLVLETVGKSIKSIAAHQGLATDASRVYTLADGSRISLAAAHNTDVSISLTDGRVYRGRAELGNWDIVLHIDEDGSYVEIPPHLVTKVQRR